MADIYRLMVPWLKDQKPYFSEYLEKAWEDESLIRMMANEDPLPPHKVVIDAIMEGAKLAHRYPDSLKHIKKKIGEINSGLGPEWVLLGNGSTEVLDMIFRTFIQPGDELIQSIPCYRIYIERANILGGKTISIPAKDNWEYDVEAIEKAITPRTRIIILANPNNPTGNLIDDSVYDELSRRDVIVVCDEAYIEYSGLKYSKVSIMKKYPNMVISRTLSKAYGLSGMRFGYALSHPETIEVISRTIMSWNVSIISAFGAYAALKDQGGLRERVRLNNEERDYLEREITRVEGLTVYHSHGNYILIDASRAGVKSEEIYDVMLKRYGILIKKQNPFKGREGLFRITVGSREENEKCLAAIKDFFNRRKKTKKNRKSFAYKF